MSHYGRVERDLMVQLSLRHRTVAVTSLEAPPQDVEKFRACSPRDAASGSWRRAAGRSGEIATITMANNTLLMYHQDRKKQLAGV